MRLGIGLALVLLHCSNAMAATPDAIPANATMASNWRIGVAVGAGFRSNPLISSDNVPVYLDLDIAWFGERWFFDNGDLGLTVTNSDFATVNLVARVNSDRVFFGLTEDGFVRVADASGQPTLLEPVIIPDRDFAVESGVELLMDGAWGSLQLGVFTDVSDTHNGTEASVSYQRLFTRGQWIVETGLSASYATAKFNDYYWGVRPDEASTVLAAYEAGAGIDVSARLGIRYVFSRSLAAGLIIEVERLNDETVASPIVADRNVTGVFAGLGYRFR